MESSLNTALTQENIYQRNEKDARATLQALAGGSGLCQLQAMLIGATLIINLRYRFIFVRSPRRGSKLARIRRFAGAGEAAEVRSEFPSPRTTAPSTPPLHKTSRWPAYFNILLSTCNYVMIIIRPDGRLIDNYQVFFCFVLVFNCLYGGLDRWETVLKARNSTCSLTWMASQGRGLCRKFCQPPWRRIFRRQALYFRFIGAKIDGKMTYLAAQV